MGKIDRYIEYIHHTTNTIENKMNQSHLATHQSIIDTQIASFVLQKKNSSERFQQVKISNNIV